ncbi:EAL domain-containing protein [Undibacterium sp.]|uniref:EAL domain-containing protein n=1 Tax=Undibacterium sp. TaxID=1914977 RepID=UPI0025E6DBC2|nr:EAL domain-containing protein [Undibacterium sp.]
MHKSFTSILAFLRTSLFHWLCSLLLFSPSAFAAGPGFQNIVGLDEINNTAIYSSVKDRHGFMWFGASSGLFRYDGQRIINFPNDPDTPNSLGSSTILAITEDESGIWCIGVEGSIHHLLGNGSFEHFPIILNGAKRTRHTPNRIVADQRGHLWLGGGSELLRFDIKTSQFTKFTSEPSDADTAHVRALAIDHVNQRLIYIQNTGLMSIAFTPNAQANRLFDLSKIDRVVGASIRNGIWLTTNNRLYKLSNKLDQLEKIALTAGEKLNKISLSQWDNQGRLWMVYNNRELASYDTNTGKTELFPSSPYDIGNRATVTLLSLYIDGDDQLWAGTGSIGVMRANLRNTGLSRRVASSEENMLWPGDDYCHLSPAQQGGVLMSACSGGLRHLSADAKTMSDLTPRLLHALEVSKTSANTPFNTNLNIRSHTYDENGDLWLASLSGLIHWDQQSKAKLYAINPYQPNAIHSALFTVHKDRQGTLWLGSAGGLLRYRKETDDFENYNLPQTGRDQIDARRILQISDAGPHQLWIVSHGQGLWHLDTQTGKSHQFRFDINNRQSLSSDEVFGTLSSRNGELWVLTSSGLNRMTNPGDLKNTQFERFTVRNGFPYQQLRDIIEDNYGDLWLGSDQGIIHFNPSTLRSQIYSHSYGLPSGGYNTGAAMRTEDGSLYFGGFKGLALISPLTLRSTLDKGLAVTLTGYGTDDQWQQQMSHPAPSSLTIPYSVNRLRVEFALLDYEAPEFNHYRYRLLGYGDQWQETGTQAQASYTRLPYGNYVLEVEGSGSDGSFSKKKLRLAIIVTPPFWRTPLAYFLYALAFALLTFLVVRRRMRLAKEREEYNTRIFESEQRMRLALRGSDNALWDWNISKATVFRAGLGFLGYSDGEIKNNQEAFAALVHPDDLAEMSKSMALILSGQSKYYRAEYRLRSKSGKWLWILDRGQVVEQRDNGEALRVTGTLRNINERKLGEEELRRMAQMDDLTGLPNRTHFSSLLQNAIEKVPLEFDKVGLFFIDLDRFKNINDSLGHQFGDRVLNQTAHRLVDHLPDNALVSRLGGDEFTVILPLAKDQQRPLEEYAEALLSAFIRPLYIDLAEVVVTLSIGISSYPKDTENVGELIQYADSAMYVSKSEGRNTYTVFHADMAKTIARRLALETSLRTAIHNQEFSLVFQAKIATASGACKGAEVLLRWTSPQHGVVCPSEFIPILEDTGLIEEVGNWVFEQACQQLAAMRAAGVPKLLISINVSVIQLVRGTLFDTVKRVLAATGVSPDEIELEVTESAVMDNAEKMILRLQEIKHLGVRLSIDDFGTGYSSFAYLTRLPIDTLKIDKAFIDGLGSQADAYAICKAIITMAHGLQLEVVAEGVETELQLSALCALGCDTIQGYLFSKPTPVDAFLHFISSNAGESQFQAYKNLPPSKFLKLVV